MQKLLDAFNASRSLSDAKRLVSYENKHPFAVCFLSSEQTALLAEATRTVSQHQRAVARKVSQ